MAALVSVIIPAHNAGAWITQTLESVLRQTQDRLQIIVVDDGSTDDTVERVQSLDRAVHLVRQDNAGTGAARNTGFRLATGDYVALLDHDDLWLPDKIQIQLSVAARHPESGLIVCDGSEFDGDRIIVSHLLPGLVQDALASSASGEVTGDFFEHFIRRSLIWTPAQTLIPRSVVEQIGPMTTVRAEPSDYEYYLRIASRYPITFHGHSLARWRYLPSSRSGLRERRHLVWAIMGIRMLKRHLRQGAFGRPAEVASALKDLVGAAARTAYYFGRSYDEAAARSHLLTLLRLQPTSATAMAYLAALWLPEPTVQRLRGLVARLRSSGSSGSVRGRSR